ncbi:hypothetical protein GETHOR_07200 [Geothrix oryzae]|uniref:PilZ domain-containing protein n=1 Tax=Geothrix oryzae TaxID=2927975 RepID=A0ABM8DP21_9BACT|nr:PilZ domain-containing protein [Geothrix oryzae]BDU68619.1 hypothetical protein GETHOR_07200 [Geothrix oryzae]
MSLVRSSGGSGRESTVEDPVQIRRALTDLQRSESEFPIKVEGTHTLPYTAWVQHLDFEKGVLHLKLIRPLPHEMVGGAPFEMLFAVGEQRFEAPLTFLGRESYLLYRFSVPLRMTQSDRRTHKRYPFRPREKAYVLAQDSGLPGFGFAGPLVNLSLGGLAFRVDRVMRLDDHMRVTPGVGFFEKGKELPMLKIRDLPKHPLFEARGRVANAWERDGEIIIGVQFLDLKDSELNQIQDVLTIREQMQRVSSSTPSAPSGTRETKAKAGTENKGPGSRMNPAGAETPDALTRLGRRGTCLVLAMAPGSAREEAQTALRAAGYLRLDPVDTLEQALERLRTDSGAASRLLVLEVPPGSEPPVTDLRNLQRELGELRELPVALIRSGGIPAETEDPLIRPLPWPGAGETAWLPLLDELAGL